MEAEENSSVTGYGSSRSIKSLEDASGSYHFDQVEFHVLTSGQDLHEWRGR